MANAHHTQRFAMQIFPEIEKEFENQLTGHNVKNKKLVQDGEINFRALYVIVLTSKCPEKDGDWVHGWTMKQVCDQNDIDRPHPNNANYREILDDLEMQYWTIKTRKMFNDF